MSVEAQCNAPNKFTFKTLKQASSSCNKTKPISSPSNLVIGTNDSSIVSKRSAERLGYFTQPQHLKHFVHKPQRRASLINIGYTIRTLLVDSIVQRFLETQVRNLGSNHFIQNFSSAPQAQSNPPGIIIVNLGCGYDPGFFKLVTDPQKGINLLNHPVRYIDVDYPELIFKKHQLIAQSEELSLILPDFRRSEIGQWIQLPTGKASYTLLGCDLCNSDEFIKKLLDLLQGKNDYHILFLSEVSTVYMPIEKSDELIEKLSQSFPNAAWSCLEQVLSSTSTAFSDTMLKHFQKLRTPIRGTIGYPTISDQVKRLQKYWETVDMSTMQDIWNAFDHYPSTRIEKRRLMRLEEFDEWEELDLFLSHYIVAIAYSQSGLMENRMCSTGIGLPPLRSWPAKAHQTVSPNTQLSKSNLSWNCTTIECGIQRRGHSTTPLSDGRYLIFGGFGLQNSHKHSEEKHKCSLTHSRLAHPLVMRLSQNLEINTLPTHPFTPSARLYHTASLIKKDDLSRWIFLFGGRLSPRVPLADAYMLHCKTLSWNSVKPSEKDGIWPSPRFRHAAISIQIGNSSHVLIHGGIGPEGIILTDTWLFDSNHLRWVRLDSLDKPIGPRHSHQIYYDSQDSNLYVFGGLTTISDLATTKRIANNVRLSLTFKKDLTVQIQSGSTEVLDFEFDNNLLHRYSHQVVMWNEGAKKLIMSGGISKNGVITSENQYILLDLSSKTCSILHSFRSKPRIMVGHTMDIIDFTKESEHKSLRLAIVLGGGATCFSFGSSFDTSAEIISDSDLKLLENCVSSNRKEQELSPELIGTFDASPEDSWNQAQTIARVEKLTTKIWKEIISDAKPVLIDTRSEIGDCLKLWTPEYLKEKCGTKKCSVHLSHQQSTSSTLRWHDKNFKYETMSFNNLIDRTLETQNSTANQIVYLRSLSRSPKEVSNFHLDFPEISNDFKVPQVVNDYIDHDRFFSSVLRISGGDMGLWAHYDTYDNILVQIKGTKQVRLWHPREIANLYIEGSSSHISNFESPDLDKFPLYRKSHPFVCILKPGDTLFIPAHWIHSVQTIEPSISINTFFKTERLENFYNSKKDIWGNLDLNPYQEIQDRILKRLMVTDRDGDDANHLQDKKNGAVHSTTISDEEAFKTFNLLPTSQRQFYLKKLAIDMIRFADQLTD